MRAARLFLALVLAACSASFGIQHAAAAVPSHSTETPDSLIRRLYRAHDANEGPFFTTDSALVFRFCTPELAALLISDIRFSDSAGDAPILNGDPLYNAQDIEIKNLKVGAPAYPSPGKTAEIIVTFTNYNEPQRVVFRLEKTSAGWRVANIDWGDGYSLRQILTSVE